MILEVRWEQTIGPTDFFLRMAHGRKGLRATRSHHRSFARLQFFFLFSFFFFFFCIPFFALNSAYVSCQLCRYIGQNGPFKRSTITGGGNVCEVKMAWVVPPWHSSDPRKSRPSLYNREASNGLLFEVGIHVVSEAGWHPAGMAKKKS